MAISKKTSTTTTVMLHTHTTIMARRLDQGMISTLQTGRAAATVLTFIVSRTPVPTVTITCGRETITSALMT